MSGEPQPWYAEGLRFACTRCGHCCTGAGVVRVSDEEIAALAVRLGLTDAQLRALHTRPLRGGERALREQANDDCTFFDRRTGCTVYADRPRQCRTWPFWRGVVHSPERWEEEARCCPGIGRGPLHDRSHIEALARDDGTSGGRKS